jgi:hypothetical protein
MRNANIANFMISQQPSSATSTVYITSYAAITNTRTKVVTTVSSGAGVHVGQTITPQEYVTVTEHLSHPIANTATASSDGTFNFIVVNGTTSWIGATPTFDPSGSFVLATSSITVEPVLDPTFSSSFALDTTSYLTKSVVCAISFVFRLLTNFCRLPRQQYQLQTRQLQFHKVPASYTLALNLVDGI